MHHDDTTLPFGGWRLVLVNQYARTATIPHGAVVVVVRRARSSTIRPYSIQRGWSTTILTSRAGTVTRAVPCRSAALFVITSLSSS